MKWVSRSACNGLARGDYVKFNPLKCIHILDRFLRCTGERVCSEEVGPWRMRIWGSI